MASFIFFLFISLSLFITRHESYDLSKVIIHDDNSTTTTSPFDFLKNLNGTHKGSQAKELVSLKKYLRTLGYIDTTNPKIPKNVDNDVFDDTLESAIKLYQQFFKLNVTGTLDEETLAMMLTPRCGFPDIYHGGTSQLSATSSFNSSLYNLTDRKWPPNKRFLTYALESFTREDAFAPIENAFYVWQSNSHFNFVHIWNPVLSDIKISFVKNDGKLGTLAQGFLPTDGRMQFDKDEAWITYEDKVGDFYLEFVALHEIGHVLGLAHSGDPKAVMAPTFHIREKRPFSIDDYDAINTMYPK